MTEAAQFDHASQGVPGSRSLPQVQHPLGPKPAAAAAPCAHALLQMGETPIIRAAHNGHFQTVKFLVDHGADVNALDMVSESKAWHY